MSQSYKVILGILVQKYLFQESFFFFHGENDATKVKVDVMLFSL